MAKKVEIFSAGCPACESTIELVNVQCRVVGQNPNRNLVRRLEIQGMRAKLFPLSKDEMRKWI